MDTPRVSIIVPNFNKGALVCHSLDCILRQTFGNWEAIVVDDCSTDSSWDIIQEYAKKDNRIIYARNEINKGGCYSRNRGAKIAKGKYLVFLDSDDWLADDCLAKRIEEFERLENLSFDLMIFEMATVHGNNSRDSWNYGDRSNALLSFLRHEIVWTMMMPIWRRESFERFGGFDESFPRLQDVELHTRALLLGLKYRFAERKTPDCFYFVDDARMTMDHEAMARKFVKAIRQYVEKMSGLVRPRAERMALGESLMAAIRWVGDSYQAGRITRQLRDELYSEILQDPISQHWVGVYARLYLLGVNRVHGFNFLYRKLYRRFLG